jgi:hypothetical protein
MAKELKFEFNVLKQNKLLPLLSWEKGVRGDEAKTIEGG